MQSLQCANCATPMIAEFCHACGQRRVRRLTVVELARDVLRRVFRFDRALAHTFWRLLRAPGRLVADYLEGRRHGILDPLQYFFSSVFVQFMVAVLTRAIAPLVERSSALTWLERLGGIVAVKILLIFWLASIWRLLFRGVRYNLAEAFVFGIYAYGTIGFLWAVVPLVDLLVPLELAVDDFTATIVTRVIEVVYITHAVAQFARSPLWLSFLRVMVVLTIGYAVLTALVGFERLVSLLPLPMPAG